MKRDDELVVDNSDSRRSLLNKTGIATALISASGWAMAGIFIRSLSEFSVFLIVAVRLTLALVISIFVLSLSQSDRFWTYIKELRQAKVWGLSLIMLSCYTCGTLAFQLAPVSEVTLLMATTQIFVVASKLLSGKLVPKPVYLGALIAFLGICFVVFPGLAISSEFSSQRVIGHGLALLFAALLASYATWFSFLSRRNKAPSSIAVSLGTFILGCSAFCPQLLQLFSSSLQKVSTEHIVAFLGLGIISTVIPTLSYAIAVKRLQPLAATSVLLLEPLLSIAFASAILKEFPSIWVIPGATFVIVGLVYSNLK